MKIIHIVLFYNMINLLIMINYLENIKAIRAKRGFTQEFVAEKLNCDYTTYGKIENGKTSLSVEKLIKLSEIFNIDITEILGLNCKNKEEKNNDNKIKILIEIELNKNEINQNNIKNALINKIDKEL